jgi:biotin synthase-related radical SAM superfamily protein
VLDDRRYAYLGGSLTIMPTFASLELYYSTQHVTFIILSNLGDFDDSVFSDMEQIVFS